MLERVWRKGNPLTVLVGMKTSTASMENSVEISLKIGNRTATSSVQSLSLVRLFATPWIAARQASLSITISRSSLKLMSIELVMASSPYNPAIPLLAIHTKETRIERDTCTPVFITALFIIARKRKQLRCPSADERTRKQWYVYTMEYYSAIKKNTFESVLMRWMKLEPIIEWSKPERKTPIQYTNAHIWNLERW